jgi:PncC family amidohydrolase
MTKREPLEALIGKKLKKKTLAIAESCTGGLISNLITNVSGSSKYFKGSVVAYSNDVKINILGVPEGLIKKHGAVSAQIAREMAIGVKELLDSSLALSITGVAGPTGGTKKKPVGTAFIAVSSAKKTITRKVRFQGNRESIKGQFSQAALELVLEALS